MAYPMLHIMIIIGVFVSLYTAESDKIILKETFNYPDGNLPPAWWSEGCPGTIKDGRLLIDADTSSFRMSTVWLGKELEGKLSVEFDAHLISSKDKANNINCFLLYSNPDASPLEETKEERKEGSYKLYHQLNGYIFTFLANGHENRARFRFRANPGFHLIAENYGYHCRLGETYKIKIEKNGNNFKYWVNGNKIMEKTIKNNGSLPEKGLFGFRTWHTTLWFDNLVVKRLGQEKNKR